MQENGVKQETAPEIEISDGSVEEESRRYPLRARVSKKSSLT